MHNTQLLHISVGVQNPKRVAEALAKLSNGEVRPFHPVDGAYVCSWGGQKNEMAGQFIEFYPKGTTLIRSAEGAEFSQKLSNDKTTTFSSTHINLNVDLHGDDVKEIAASYGYPYFFRPSHGGPLHEVWMEGELLVELVTSELSARK